MNRGFFYPSKELFTCIILLIISFALMLARLNAAVQSLRVFMAYSFSFAYERPSEILLSSGHLASRIKEIILVHRENTILKQKIENTVMVQARLHAAILENQQLKKLLQLKTDRYPETVSADVLGYDPHQWMQLLWVSAGENFGVKTDAPVLALQGDVLESSTMRGAVVGRILQVDGRSSRVLLISDPLSSVSVMLEKNSEIGLLQGQGNFMVTMEYLNQLAEVQPGDWVVTSGQGGIFPAGLPVGYVRRIIASHSGFKRVEIFPAVSLSQLRNVLILKTEEKTGG